LKVWDIASGKELANHAAGHADDVTAVVFSEDGNYLATGSMDKTREVVLGCGQAGTAFGDNCVRTNLLNPRKVHQGIRPSPMSPDNQRLATGVDDGTESIFRSRTNGARVVQNCYMGNGSWNTALRVQTGRKRVWRAADYDKTVKIWNPSNGRRAASLNADSPQHHEGRFSRDGQGGWTTSERGWVDQSVGCGEWRRERMSLQARGGGRGGGAVWLRIWNRPRNVVFSPDGTRYRQRPARTGIQ
jgi:WD40 repeat protein